MGAPGSSLRLIYGVASAPSCPLEQMCPAQGVTQGPTRLTYGRAGAPHWCSSYSSAPRAGPGPNAALCKMKRPPEAFGMGTHVSATQQMGTHEPLASSCLQDCPPLCCRGCRGVLKPLMMPCDALCHCLMPYTRL